MTDTQDTNLPKMEEGLEDVKQTVEAPEPAAQELTAPEEVVEEVQETLEAAAGDESARKLTKPEILAKMKEIAEDVEQASKTVIDTLKQNFYRLHNAVPAT